MNKQNNGWIVWVGGAFLLLGIICSIFVLSEYWHSVKSFRFRFKDGFDTLGTALSGTAGLLFTIAGVIFFTYSLYQTTHEMKSTQEIMRGQLAESTFFNLVRHHRELSISLEDSGGVKFSTVIALIKRKLDDYASSMINRTFKDFITTHKSPDVLYRETPKAQTSAKSMIHVAAFIQERLQENAVFFHKTFFYGLSSDEKFLLGMVIENGLEEIKGNFSFNYTEYYVKHSTYHNKINHGFFPPLEQHEIFGHFFLLKNLDLGNLKLNKKEIETAFSLSAHSAFAVLEKIEYLFIYREMVNNTGSLSDDPVWFTGEGFLHFYPEEKINLYPFFEKELVQIFEKTNEVQIRMKFIYKIPNQSEEYEVWFPEFAINWRFVDKNSQKSESEKFLKQYRKELSQGGGWKFEADQIIKNVINI